jgi:serine/threonine protein kinase/Tfp pilus assembly protein PilF
MNDGPQDHANTPDVPLETSDQQPRRNLATADYDPGEVAGTMIGPYKLLQPLGKGGMGIVWMAEQTEPVRRRVALKIIKPGMDSEQVMARFEAERQALALMNHDYIARVFDAGTVSEATARGRPYFVMELVKGVPVTDFCNEQQLRVEERLNLFVSICQAVQHAHMKGVIHRDLKPSNVLVMLVDNRAVPKVIDFGLAKAMHQPLTDRTMVTTFGAIIGTLEYMSPEQADLNALDIDTRTDIYSLGVMLYELLTGTTPLAHARLRERGYAEAVRMIREIEPVRPSTQISQSGEHLAALSTQRHTDPASLNKLVRGDLDWIVMKALHKNRAERYQTANELAADVERYLRHEPIMARPPSLWYPLQRFYRRNRVVVVAAGLFLFVLMAASVISTLLAFRAAEAEAQAKADKDRAVTAEKEARDAETQANQDKTRAQTAEKDAAQKAKEAQNSAAIAQAVNDFLRNDVLAQADPFNQFGADRKPDPDLSLRAVLDRAAAKIHDRFKDQPLVEAAIRQTIGETYDNLEMSSAAASHLQVAVELLRQNRGDAHAETMEARRKLASVYWKLGRSGATEEILTPLIAYYRRELGPEHPKTLDTLNSLGLCYQDQRKVDAAETCFLEAYEGRRKVLGEADPETLNSLNCLGWFYYAGVSRFDRAEPYFVKALALRRIHLPAKHPHTQNSIHNLALLYDAMGKADAAEPRYREALALSRETFGEESGRTLFVMRNLGQFLAHRKRFDEAEKLLRKAIEANGRLYGDNSGATYNAVRDLAECLLLKGENEEALALCRRFEAAVGPDGREGRVLNGVAKCLVGTALIARGKYEEAEAALANSLAVYEKHGPDLWQRYGSAALLGESLALQKKFAQAEPLLLQGYDGMTQRSATIPWCYKDRIVRAGEQIVRLYETWGMPTKAKQWRERLDAPLVKK